MPGTIKQMGWNLDEATELLLFLLMYSPLLLGQTLWGALSLRVDEADEWEPSPLLLHALMLTLKSGVA